MATIDTLAADLVTWTDTDSAVLPNAVAGECINTTIRRLERIRPYRGTITSVNLAAYELGLSSSQVSCFRKPCTIFCAFVDLTGNHDLLLS